ncbi:VacJ family lipoprotein [Massilia sp. W12]|uniref:MlaA family lipoprotein n=1 Tax=Massilia sp. W12 TaxID=3126507 RepID=UPI0030D5B193
MNSSQAEGGSRPWMRLLRLLAMLACVASLSACATGSNPRDPLEGFNRAMFNFNDALDRAAIKPAATVYQQVTPQPVQTGVGNFFGNIGDVWTMVNQFLQGKVKHGLNDMMRVAVNSTLGLGGLLDIASEAGLSKHKEDFGQTLGVWGIKSGPYLVLPVFGPSTFRDSLAFGADLAADPWRQVKPRYQRNSGTALRLLDQRASLLDAGNLMEEAALDRYEFVRDAYLQRRASMIEQGADAGDEAAPAQQQAQSDAQPQAVQSDAQPAAVLAQEYEALPPLPMQQARNAWRLKPALLHLETLR